MYSSSLHYNVTHTFSVLASFVKYVSINFCSTLIPVLHNVLIYIIFSYRIISHINMHDIHI